MSQDPPDETAALPDTPEDGRRSRARARRNATREALVRATAVAFARDGYLATTPAAIAERAGVTRATFYHHFDSKADAFSAVLRDLVDRLEAAVQGVDLGPTAAPPEAQLTANLLRVLDILLEDRDLSRLLLVEAIGKDDVLQARVDAFQAFVLGMIREALVDGQGAGLVRPLDPGIAAHALLGAVTGVLAARLARDEADVDRAGIARELLACALCGVGSAELRAAVLGDGPGG